MGISTGDISVFFGPASREEEFVLSPLKCAFWPRERTLLIADLHLGHTSTYHAHGIALPSAQITADLHRLSEAAERFSAARVLVLGDLLHSRAGMTDELSDTVARWRSSFDAEIDIVSGNHDRAIELVAEAWRLNLLGVRCKKRDFVFKHYPEPEDDRFVWCGHEHPAAHFGNAVDGVRLPCFATTAQLAILPAFSGLAAGSARGIPDGATLFAVTPGGVIRTPRGSHNRSGRA